jgi:hypothetical protein
MVSTSERGSLEGQVLRNDDANAVAVVGTFFPVKK